MIYTWYCYRDTKPEPSQFIEPKDKRMLNKVWLKGMTLRRGLKVWEGLEDTKLGGSDNGCEP